MMVGNMRKNTTLPVFCMMSTPLLYVNNYKYLGLLMDEKLVMTQQASNIIGHVTAKLKTLGNIRKYVSVSVIMLIYKTLILPLFEYANLTHTLLPLKYRNKMQRLQNRALRIIFYHESNADISDLHKRAGLLTLTLRADFQLLNLMYRRSFDHEKYPKIDLIRDTRASGKIKFHLPRPRTEKFKKFPLFRGAHLWDELPIETQKCDSYIAYKRRVKEFLENKGNYPPQTG